MKSHKIFIYPIIVVLCLLFMTTFKVSGSSIGVYYSYLYGQNAKDPSLLFGTPQKIRSDEWLVNTQLAISQSRTGFQRTNPVYNEGRDVSVISDTPYKEWSTVFRPQNLSFFVLPFEYAFAFKWWFILSLLLISSYFFVLKTVKGAIIPAVLISLTVSFSPFVFWWYLSGTILTMAYGYMIILASCSILDQIKRNRTWNSKLLLKLCALTYILISFALMLYPPFQVPVMIAVLFYILGYSIQESREGNLRSWLMSTTPILVSLFLAVSVVGIFLSTRSETINAITGTAYPGGRTVESGGYDAMKLLTTPLQVQLERGDRGMHYFDNQSEASNFILPSTSLLIPLIFILIWKIKKHEVFDWILLSIIFCNLLFLAHLFLPMGSLFAKISLLYLVPQQRLVIGLGFLSVISLAYIIQFILARKKLPKLWYWSTALYVVIFLGFSVYASQMTTTDYPLFISSVKLILLFNGVTALSLFMMLSKKFVFGLFLLAIFSILSVVKINPLYTGLGPIYTGQLSSKISSVSTPESVWGVVDNLYLESVPQTVGKQAITGVAFYPNTRFWKDAVGSQYAYDYNRYAHVLITDDNLDTIKLVQPDLFTTALSCGTKTTATVNRLLSTEPLNSSCVRLLDKVVYPSVTIYLYSRV
jgi:hypothetical protein